MRLHELTEAPTMPRNVRNNNPGNIKVSKDEWQGSKGNDGTFVTFDSPEMGARAMAKVLNNYQTKYGLKTIKDIMMICGKSIHYQEELFHGSQIHN